MAIKIYEQFAPFANPADGDYPHGSFKNDSIPGAEDGTPLDAVWGNDMVGFTDALLAEAGIVPSGQPDKLGASQRVDAIKQLEKAASSITNQHGGTLQNTADYVNLIETAEVIDYNFDVPYRKLTDYTISQAYGFAHSGQSVAEGGVSNDSVAGLIPNPYPNQMKMLYPQPCSTGTGSLGNTVVTLSEAERVTIASSYMRNVIKDNFNDSTSSAVFHGAAFGGQDYYAIKKGAYTEIYEKVITGVQNVTTAMPNIIYKGVSVIHGEQDSLNNNVNYQSNLVEWQADFNADIKAITGQSQDIPMFLCQTSSSSGYGYVGGIAQDTFTAPMAQLNAHKNNSLINLVCAKYHLKYADHSHITNNAQRVLGEYYAKAFRAVNAGGIWEPLRPSSIVGSGNTVTVSFVGRVGNLVFDTSLVNAATNMGFDYIDDAGRTITNVTTNGTTVTITLSGTIGANAKLSYAYNNGVAGADAARAGNGSRGNLRDSDTTVSLYDSARLYNWCVIFKENVL